MVTAIDFRVGDVVRVSQKIKEGDKTRSQVFEGVVLKIRGRGDNKSYTVRKKVGDIAVERIWPFNSPSVEKVTVKESSKKKPRRSKLYYLRNTK